MKTILVDAVNTFYLKDEESIHAEMHELLETYPHTKIIVTNADEEMMAQLGMINMPYHIFTLRNKPPKTDPQYFSILLEHFQLTAAEVVYFEHNPAAVKSAQSIGISTYHYNHEMRDLKALQAFLDSQLFDQ